MTSASFEVGKTFSIMSYVALVKSLMEYGSSVWDPHLEKDKESLEKIQKKAARFIKGDHRSRSTGCVTEMLRDLDLASLQQSRKEDRLCFFYKISNGLVPAIPKDTYLEPVKNKRKIKAKTFSNCVTTNFVNRYQNLNCFIIPTSTDTTYKSSFSPRTISE